MNNQIDYILNGKRKMMTGGIPQKKYLAKTNRMSTDRFLDADKDGVPNGLDCFPFNSKRHASWYGEVYANGDLIYTSSRGFQTPNEARADAERAKQGFMKQNNSLNYTVNQVYL